MSKPKLTHVKKGNQPGMVNVGDKAASHRRALAETLLEIPPAVSRLFTDGDIRGPKGPVFQTAIIAGTMAVKRTSEWIPFCHPLPITGCDITLALEGHCIRVRCAVETTYKTGVEMEALVGASAAALTVYDMCKAVSHNIVIRETRLLAKSGGKRNVRG